MTLTVNQMKRGEKYLIKEIHTEMLPIKLLELGCLPGNKVELVEIEISSLMRKSWAYTYSVPRLVVSIVTSPPYSPTNSFIT